MTPWSPSLAVKPNSTPTKCLYDSFFFVLLLLLLLLLLLKLSLRISSYSPSSSSSSSYSGGFCKSIPLTMGTLWGPCLISRVPVISWCPHLVVQHQTYYELEAFGWWNFCLSFEGSWVRTTKTPTLKKGAGYFSTQLVVVSEKFCQHQNCSVTDLYTSV